MPDVNNALETALREIAEQVPGITVKQRVAMRFILINFRNKSSKEEFDKRYEFMEWL